jgi:DNA mismatch endonuclease (patch repair protein)
MASVHSRGNKTTELRLVAVFKACELVGWRRNYPLPGKPDFTFPRHRIAIFVDGCFWHGCAKHGRVPLSNRQYWVKKIDQNKRRDRKISRDLRSKGWTVLRLWEHDLENWQTNRKIRTAIKLVLGTEIHNEISQ